MDACAACGYDYAALPRPALAPSLALGAAQHAARLTAADAALRHRPAPGVWSPLEYACHVRDVLRVQRDRVLRTQAEEQPQFVPMDRDRRAVDEDYNGQDPARVAGELRSAGAAIAALLDGLDGSGWARTGVYNYPTAAVRDVDWIARHTLHEVIHHLMDVDRGLGAAG
ncbi:DinB family protein [Blastococcus deserti]|uniref:DinB family protein n=1 Tax=Blastococcus deserti TaxID=2259033 RepID=A0ABW4XES8_9ACTN